MDSLVWFLRSAMQKYETNLKASRMHHGTDVHMWNHHETNASQGITRDILLAQHTVIIN